MLGVTPEYARFRWPAKTTLIACERSESMIQHVWPGSTLESATVIQGNWLDLTQDLGKFDLILGDGVLTQLAYQDQYDELGWRVSNLLLPGGRLLLRLFASSGEPEAPEHVLENATITNVNEFKLRLGMALSNTRSAYDVAVSEIWSVWDQARRERPGLNERWSAEAASTIEGYRESAATYSFPPLNRIQPTFSRHINVAKVYVPNYKFGDCCPTMIFRG